MNPKLHYGLIKYKQTCSYKILKDIIEHFTFVHLIDSLVNVNHHITVVILKCTNRMSEARVNYNLIKYKKMREYKVLEDISEHVTLFQLMDSLGNVNHAISVVGSWIF